MRNMVYRRSVGRKLALFSVLWASFMATMEFVGNSIMLVFDETKLVLGSTGAQAKSKVVLITTMIVMLALGDVFVDRVDAVNTTAWTFEGHEAAEQLLDLTPLMYYLGLIIGIIVVLIR